MQISYDDFRKVDMRVGKVVEVEDLPAARNPSYKMRIEFGEGIGVKTSVAQITIHSKEELLGKTVVAVVNFPPKRIANVDSDVLTLGASDGAGSWIVIRPTREVKLGTRIE